MKDSDQSSKIEGSIFSFLSSLLDKHNVHAVLVGGYSLIANKVQRMTFDIDFIMTAPECKRIEQDLIATGYSVLSRQDAFVQFKSERSGYRDLDILLGDKQTIDQLISQGKQILIAGEKFIVPSPKHLIAMKLHSISGNRKRELKDFPDIVALMSANAIDPYDEDIIEMFKKYGLMNLHKRIIGTRGI